ncbi:MAG: lipocalin-like domain-containing protein [Candidatus Marithrix sp.]
MDKFIGTWQLLSCRFIDNENNITYRYPFDKSATGYLIYTQAGYMSVSIMTTTSRQKFNSKPFTAGSPEEKIAAAETYISYSGRYEIRADKVIHHVEASLFPNYVGTDLERNFIFTDDQLSLTTNPILINKEQYKIQLIWQRVE